MNDTDTLKGYIRDLAYLLRERGSQAARDYVESTSPFDEGRESTYREILAVMQHQAEAFGLEREELCLANFDPLAGDLGPPPPEPANE